MVPPPEFDRKGIITKQELLEESKSVKAQRDRLKKWAYPFLVGFFVCKVNLTVIDTLPKIRGPVIKEEYSRSFFTDFYNWFPHFVCGLELSAHRFV